jgi:DNA-binding IclR family transcriptional regulator
MPRPALWMFVTNHAIVLLQVWQNPDLTVREIAEHVGITERAVHRILTDLSRSTYIVRRRVGRRSHYTVAPERTLRHPLLEHMSIGRLLTALDHRRER